MIHGMECWKTMITTPVAMDRGKPGSEGTGGFYVIDKDRVHIGSPKEPI
jgi:hypothetical protein